MILAIFITFVLLVSMLGPIATYNRLVRRRNEVANAYGAVDSVLKQRFDLLPNLVETVKRYAEHESETFSKVAELRCGKGSYDELSAEQKTAFNQGFKLGIRDFYAVSERYPELRASNHFMHLQRTLNEVEEQLSAARRTYNSMATDYNNAIQTFPSSIIAGMFLFRPERLLETPAEERTRPDFRELFKD